MPNANIAKESDVSLAVGFIGSCTDPLDSQTGTLSSIVDGDRDTSVSWLSSLDSTIGVTVEWEIPVNLHTVNIKWTTERRSGSPCAAGLDTIRLFKADGSNVEILGGAIIRDSSLSRLDELSGSWEDIVKLTAQIGLYKAELWAIEAFGNSFVQVEKDGDTLNIMEASSSVVRVADSSGTVRYCALGDVDAVADRGLRLFDGDSVKAFGTAKE